MRRAAFTILITIGLLMVGGMATWAQPPDAHKGISDYTGPETWWPNRSTTSIRPSPSIEKGGQKANRAACM
jgi:hypothetical protein